MISTDNYFTKDSNGRIEDWYAHMVVTNDGKKFVIWLDDYGTFTDIVRTLVSDMVTYNSSKCEYRLEYDCCGTDIETYEIYESYLSLKNDKILNRLIRNNCDSIHDNRDLLHMLFSQNNRLIIRKIMNGGNMYTIKDISFIDEEVSMHIHDDDTYIENYKCGFNYGFDCINNGFHVHRKNSIKVTLENGDILYDHISNDCVYEYTAKIYVIYDENSTNNGYDIVIVFGTDKMISMVRMTI
jgi:hypothetical protein